MKPNFFLSLMALILSLLLGYLVYHIASGKPNDMICGVVSVVCMAATAIPLIGLKYESGRMGVNLRVLSTIALIFFVILNIAFAALEIVMPYYVVINGLALVVFLVSFYELSRIKDI